MRKCALIKSCLIFSNDSFAYGIHFISASFFNKTLRDFERKYDIMEKHAYALVKALKYFRVFVLHSKITAYVPNSEVKEILVKLDCEGKRGSG